MNTAVAPCAVPILDSAPLLQHLGLGDKMVAPGFPQLLRPCDIDGHLVYHLITLFEKRGMVTLFAFDKLEALQEGGCSRGDY